MKRSVVPVALFAAQGIAAGPESDLVIAAPSNSADGIGGLPQLGVPWVSMIFGPQHAV